jgi:GTP cyclohydrolase I
VFLETQFDELIERLGDDKTIDVLRKTAKKMSPAGLEAAQGLNYSPAAAALLGRALGAA